MGEELVNFKLSKRTSLRCFEFYNIKVKSSARKEFGHRTQPPIKAS